MKRLALLFAFLGMGCATITMTTTCPADSMGVSFALSGNTTGATALSLLGGMLGSGALTPLMAAKLKAAPATPTTATMTYRYLPIFGADGGSLTCQQPASSPSPTIVVVPNGPPPPQILH